MMFNLYAIKDELSEFASPLPIEDDAQAKRFFIYKVTTEPLMKDNPKDFSIWKIGSYDSLTGRIIACEPNLIERGKKHE